MGLRIQNNIEAFNTHRQLTATSAQASKSMEKLSSGYRINRAADDAAGLAISEKMRGQIGGLAQAQRNAQDGISLVQTAEGALTEVHSMLQRVRDLKVQFTNGTLSSDDKDAIAAEVYQIARRSGASSTDTKFNGTAVFGAGTFTFQVGANDWRDDRDLGGELHRLDRRRRHRRPVRARRPWPPPRRAKTALATGGLSTVADDRHRDQERVDGSRQLRRGAEPSGASPEQPGDLPGEPDVV